MLVDKKASRSTAIDALSFELPKLQPPAPFKLQDTEITYSKLCVMCEFCGARKDKKGSIPWTFACEPYARLVIDNDSEEI